MVPILCISKVDLNTLKNNNFFIGIYGSVKNILHPLDVSASQKVLLYCKTFYSIINMFFRQNKGYLLKGTLGI